MLDCRCLQVNFVINDDSLDQFEGNLFMGSIVDLCWTTCQELFADVDLDELYLRQVSIITGGNNKSYPYVLLIYTGKITIGVKLTQSALVEDWNEPSSEWEEQNNIFISRPPEEPSE